MIGALQVHQGIPSSLNCRVDGSDTLSEKDKQLNANALSELNPLDIEQFCFATAPISLGLPLLIRNLPYRQRRTIGAR